MRTPWVGQELSFGNEQIPDTVSAVGSTCKVPGTRDADKINREAFYDDQNP